MSLAILVLGYSRPELVERCIRSIQFLDLPPSIEVVCSIDKWSNESVKDDNRRTVSTVNKLQQHGLVDRVILRKKNLGCALNVTQSVAELLSEYHNVFVVEDDLEFSEKSAGLIKVASSLLSEELVSFTAYCHRSGCTTFFTSQRFSSQSWLATRKNWDGFSLEKMKDVQLTRMQKNDIRRLQGGDLLKDFAQFQQGNLDSWAVPWNIFCFLNNRKMLYPPRSFVINNSHLIGAQRTQGIQFEYDLEHKFPMELDKTSICENLSYLNHFSFYRRALRRMRSVFGSMV